MSDEKWGAGPKEEWQYIQHFGERELVGMSAHDNAGCYVTHEIFHGQHPNSTQDNNLYLDMEGEAVPFHGHRVRQCIEIVEYNYLKTSGLSGNDVRGGCRLRIRFNDRVVYTKDFRGAAQAAIWYAANVHVLLEHPVQLWAGRGENFPDLIGRKVWFRGQEAWVCRFFPDQGCVMLKSEKGILHTGAGAPGVGRHLSREDTEYVKEDLLAESIWWFRGSGDDDDDDE